MYSLHPIFLSFWPLTDDVAEPCFVGKVIGNRGSVFAGIKEVLDPALNGKRGDSEDGRVNE